MIFHEIMVTHDLGASSGSDRRSFHVLLLDTQNSTTVQAYTAQGKDGETHERRAKIHEIP